MKRRKYFGLASAVLLAMSGCTTSSYINELTARNARFGNVERTINYQVPSRSYAEPKIETKSVSNKIQDYGDEIKHAAKEFHLSESFLRKVIDIESSGNHANYSHKGAIGFFQITRGTARYLGINPHNPVQNIHGGAAYLRMLLDKYHGDKEKAIAAYNWGPANFDSLLAHQGENWQSYQGGEATLGQKDWKLPTETRDYLRKMGIITPVQKTNNDSTTYAAAKPDTSYSN